MGLSLSLLSVLLLLLLLALDPFLRLRRRFPPLGVWLGVAGGEESEDDQSL